MGAANALCLLSQSRRRVIIRVFPYPRGRCTDYAEAAITIRRAELAHDL
jgi:hypothetical protein